jgi:lipopolysaccharide/colanic/teichoic acid biosynthesis glycosyltransferase
VHQTPQFSNANSAEIRLSPELEGGTWQGRSDLLVGVPGSGNRETRTSSEISKRIEDVCLSLLLLVLLSPLIALIAVVIWARDDGPILYISERIGRNGRRFLMYKFRTMIVNAESIKHALDGRNKRSAILFKVSNDPRVTRIGRLLRKYSLDEIPQLINILRGEMSLVGPRPPLASEVEQYQPQHFIRLKVLPGLTGLWQINARGSPSFHDYIKFDTLYVQNMSFWLDIKILVRTVGVVLAGTGE